MILVQVKEDVANLNNTFKIADVKIIFDEAIDKIAIQDWKKCVDHTENL